MINDFTQEMQEIMKDRGTEYGTIYESFTDIAALWSILLRHEVKPTEVAWCMIALKLARGFTKHDTMVDIANYAYIADELTKEST